MDALQQQINELNYKVNQLHNIVEQVSQQLMTSDVLSGPEVKTYPDSSTLIPCSDSSAKPPGATHGQFKLEMEHKDILTDDREINSLVAPEGEVIFSRDLQVRRLTAQLTAAYNRIAALEEQLMACRRSSKTSSLIKVAQSADCL
ncbi:MAG TPA: hypothetical protein DCF68_01715 [Cyanothece sp. UBA12306]|nr:hypothetical protein [Cyanothece sp. UBA12306]